MVDSANPGFLSAAGRFGDFCNQLSAGSVYLQSVLKYCFGPLCPLSYVQLLEVIISKFACTSHYRDEYRFRPAQESEWKRADTAHLAGEFAVRAIRLPLGVDSE